MDIFTLEQTARMVVTLIIALCAMWLGLITLHKVIVGIHDFIHAVIRDRRARKKLRQVREDIEKKAPSK